MCLTECTYNLIAESFLEAGAYDDAKRMFQKAAASQPTEGWLPFQLARVDYRAGRYREAREKLEVYVAHKLRVGGRTPYQLLQDLMEKAALTGDEESVISLATMYDLGDSVLRFPEEPLVADCLRALTGGPKGTNPMPSISRESVYRCLATPNSDLQEK